MDLHVSNLRFGDFASPVFDLAVLHVIIQVDTPHVRDLGLIRQIVEAHHVEYVLSVHVVCALEVENDGAAMARCVPHPDRLVERKLEDEDTAAPDLKVVRLVVGQETLYLGILDLDQDGPEVQILVLVGHLDCLFEH